LLVGLELDRPARPYCEQLMTRGVLCKETHERVIRLAPPLVTAEADLQWMVEQLFAVFA
jgi:ornithine--oxo-acid transaminase